MYVMPRYHDVVAVPGQNRAITRAVAEVTSTPTIKVQLESVEGMILGGA